MLLRHHGPQIPRRIPTDDGFPTSDSLPSPLERNPQSPMGWRKRDSDGVGLGIVALLERSGGAGDQRRKLVVGAASASIAFISKKQAAASSGDFPAADFLRYCYLCRRRLDGRDIYMYRGEKAFCSMECRHQLMVSDECLEKCGSEVCRSADISTYPCSNGGSRGRRFVAGIAAA
ncbi:hypothetical protein AXF42_Ash005019 [Apostasia shenzhenica]|uniref:FLZ-type domain-containing protein n=1 Tax=Apostasia shenzhenica TaxID=1088818 RepID=A0A2I0B892_9ASPA|nr:hypothetical protein AXF42_Ash005019 [Apostasia shenzhenica]